MKQIFKLDKEISILCLSVMLITVIAQVLMRELFNFPLVGAEEFVRYMMIWIVLFPLAFTLREGGTHRDDRTARPVAAPAAHRLEVS